MPGVKLSSIGRTLSIGNNSVGTIIADRVDFRLELELTENSSGTITNSKLGPAGQLVEAGTSVVWSRNDFSSGFVVASGSSTATIDLSGNYWGTTDTDLIEARIRHQPDDPSLPLVQYQPILDSLSDPDFNGDGAIDIADLDQLIGAVVSANHPAAFDLTGDGLVNDLDVDDWLSLAGAANLPSGNPYLPGDADLDGVVDVADFNAWNGNKFTNQAAWSAGDFNADGAVDVGDFNVWNGHRFQSSFGGSPLRGTLAIETDRVTSADHSHRVRQAVFGEWGTQEEAQPADESIASVIPTGRHRCTGFDL